MAFNMTADILTIVYQISKICLISEVTDHEKYEVILLWKSIDPCLDQTEWNDMRAEIIETFCDIIIIQYLNIWV